MAGPSIPQLSPSVVGAVQWTLVGVEVAVVAYLVAWLGRRARLARLLRLFRRRTALHGARGADEMRAERPVRLVSIGGGAPEAVEGRHGMGGRLDSRTPRGSRPLSRTPPRGTGAVDEPGPPLAAVPLATLHCPGCGTHLARGELAPRLVMRCPGCGRRVAMRLDGDRVTVTLDG